MKYSTLTDKELAARIAKCTAEAAAYEQHERDPERLIGLGALNRMQVENKETLNALQQAVIYKAKLVSINS